MNNIEVLATSQNKNCSLFAQTILIFKNSQGFYSRLFSRVMDLEPEELEELMVELKTQNFKDTLDVVLWLEE